MKPRTAASRRGRRLASIGVLAVSLLLGACNKGADPAQAPAGLATTAVQAGSAAPSTTPGTAAQPAANGSGPYAHAGAGELTGAARSARPLVYVPNQVAGTLEIIDPATNRIITHVRVPASPEHVVPSWDLSTLWVNSDKGDALTPIDPRTGRVGKPVAVRDPYNLYFTPDGRNALVMASRFRSIDVRDPKTMRLVRSLPVPRCAGINHADFTADLTHLLVSCEFSGHLLVLDAHATRVLKVLDFNGIHTPGEVSSAMARVMAGPRSELAAGANSMPQDVRLTPDAKFFRVADILRNGVWFINTTTFTVDHFVPTGKGAHGIYPSRDATRIFVTNRDEGTITVFDARTDAIITKWVIPGHATPDMGGVTADGSQLWLSGRYSSAVYVINTTTGRLIREFHTDAGPHGLLVWPQPGRFSLGHTGNTR